MEAIARIIEDSGGEVVGILCLAELGFLEPRKKLSGYDVETIITY
ncbi:hypothetical protein M388_05330 [Mesotoga sp. Brook.08.YT.4.2.5.4.]|nr:MULTISPECIES: hypothetical protein [unclassified Mesotoga]RAO95920.1 hypothetical protein M388_05330 [Mesotoga sp. Brook.08.YT.4.2.5.4.]